MTNKEYREHEGVSRSDLWQMSKSPMHYKYQIEHPQEETQGIRIFSRYITVENRFGEKCAVKEYRLTEEVQA